jgi:hypothetical protein
MLLYPQLSTGALSQFPVLKRRRTRTVVNTAADGRRMAYGDVAGATVEWQLSYTGLSDAELAALQSFHAFVEGSLQPFTFVDPAANLLAWSEDLRNAVWSTAPLLTLSDSGAGAWVAANGAAGPQTIAQTLNAPAGYRYCFSVYARCAAGCTARLLLGTESNSHALGEAWTRIWLSRSGDSNASSILFGVEVPAGASVEISHPQVEAQAAPSPYKLATTGGVYENARFRDDTFRFTTTGVNRHDATITILYANHL